MTAQHTIQILLVDDEEINLQNVGHFLKHQGFEISTASDGTKAIKLLQESHFDLVISDLKMGEVDGVQVMQAAKELQMEITDQMSIQQDDHTPVVIFQAGKNLLLQFLPE